MKYIKSFLRLLGRILTLGMLFGAPKQDAYEEESPKQPSKWLKRYSLVANVMFTICLIVGGIYTFVPGAKTEVKRFVNHRMVDAEVATRIAEAMTLERPKGHAYTHTMLVMQTVDSFETYCVTGLPDGSVEIRNSSRALQDLPDNCLGMTKQLQEIEEKKKQVAVAPSSSKKGDVKVAQK